MTAETDAVKKGGTQATVLGAFTLVMGMLAMMMPGLVGASAILIVGIMMIFGGVLRMFWAFQEDSMGQGVLVFLFGGLTLVSGGILVANPLIGSAVFTLLLAVYLVSDGAFEIIAFTQAKRLRGRGWLLFGGIVSILLGVVIWRQFPLSGMMAIGILFGIKLFMIGLIMITTGSMVRGIVKEAARE